jgi:N-methylhydantoinase A
MHVLESGYDPRKFTLVTFGGAGPIHACRLAQKLGITKVIVPFAAGVASAYGLLISPISMNFVNSYRERLEYLDWHKVNSLLNEMEMDGRRIIGQRGNSGHVIERFADIRHVGQGHEVLTPLPDGQLSEEDLLTLKTSFHSECQRLFNRTIKGVPLEVLNWRVRVSDRTSGIRFPHHVSIEEGDRELADDMDTDFRINPKLKPSNVSPKHNRKVFFEELGGYVECPVYERSCLGPDGKIPGPAIIEEKESTTVVSPFASCVADRFGNLILEFRVGVP